MTNNKEEIREAKKDYNLSIWIIGFLFGAIASSISNYFDPIRGINDLIIINLVLLIMILILGMSLIIQSRKIKELESR